LKQMSGEMNKNEMITISPLFVFDSSWKECVSWMDKYKNQIQMMQSFSPKFNENNITNTCNPSLEEENKLANHDNKKDHGKMLPFSTMVRSSPFHRYGNIRQNMGMIDLKWNYGPKVVDNNSSSSSIMNEHGTRNQNKMTQKYFSFFNNFLSNSSLSSSAFGLEDHSSDKVSSSRLWHSLTLQMPKSINDEETHTTNPLTFGFKIQQTQSFAYLNKVTHQLRQKAIRMCESFDQFVDKEIMDSILS